MVGFRGMPGGPGKGRDGRMKVAFRYCGGCTPRYDRGSLVKRLTE